jgi:hypothetical protein
VKILRPPAVFSASAYSTPLTLPIGPAYLAGTLEAAGYRVDVVDGIGEGLSQIRISADGRLKTQGLTTEEIVRRIVDNSISTELGGIRQEISVVFTDVQMLRPWAIQVHYDVCDSGTSRISILIYAGEVNTSV